MFHVFKILLHRPFVQYGHLQSVLPDVAFDSFTSCATAANSIAQILESFRRIHSFRLAPYFIFYASYVSSSIHVRIAAQKHLQSNAYSSLKICLAVFDDNVRTNPAVKKAKAIIQNLMERMGVSIPEEMPSPQTALNSQIGASLNGSSPSSGSQRRITDADANFQQYPIQQMNFAQDWNMQELDFEAILESFETSNGLGVGAGSDIVPGSAQVPSYVATPFSGPIGNMSDVLFDFDGSSPEGRWASPPSGSSSY